MVKTKVKVKVYLGLAILDLSKMLIYEFHYDYQSMGGKALLYGNKQLCV